MNREQAIRDLGSAVIRERLAAARHLARTAIPEDEEVLRLHLAEERVQWVRDALRAALSRTQLAEGSSHPLNDELQLDSEFRARAVLEVTGQLLHELEPLIGLLRVHLLQEWPAFKGTRSERSLQRLEDFFDVMADLHAAAQVPVMREVLLPELMTEIRADLPSDRGGRVQLAGPELRVTSDPRLLTLVIRNAIDNALDASDGGEVVVLSWGRAREGFFVSVVDHGVGLPHDFEVASLPTGTSTKQGHLGMGLSLMRQAAESLGADLELRARPERGSVLAIRCPDGA